MNKIIIFAEELRQYIYCKRIIYFRRNGGFKQRKSYLMIKGENYHEDKNKYKPNSDKILRNQYFIYNGLGARVDLIRIEGPNLVIVEYKRFLSESKPSLSHIIQSTTGGIVASHNLNKKFTNIEIQGYNGMTRYILVDDTMIQKVDSIATEIRKMIKSNQMPNPTSDDRKCDECEFWKVCYRI